MRDVLHGYLLERPSGASPRELLDLIFTSPRTDLEFGPRFLQTLLGADPRFAFAPDTGRWIATAHAALAQPLADVTFVVVDLETTGGMPARGHAIIEIGAIKLRNGEVVARFETLVHPGRRLPPFITALTGIAEHMLAQAPHIDAVLPGFIEFTAGAVLVAHNAAFDFSFLDAARRPLRGDAFEQPQLCTLRLARRLLPQLPRRSLDALAGHFGIPLVDRHRAFGDARITVEVLFHLLELARRRGVLRLGELLDFQHRASDGRRFLCRLPRQRVAALPDTPGIYRLLGEDGRLLYVGKAKNLRRRVSTYITNATAHRGKVLDLIRHACDVQVELAGSELEAALRESEVIRHERPPYNRLGKHLPQIAFLKLTTSDPFPRLAVVSRMTTRAGRYFGPFRSRASALQAQSLIARLFHLRTCAPRLRPGPEQTPCLLGQTNACSAPCAARVDPDAYGAQVAAAVAFFDGEIGAAERELARRRQAHSEALRFEAAARAQRDLELVRRMRRRQRTLSWIVAQQHFAVMQAAADGCRVLLYGVTHGRLAARAAAADAAGLAAFAAALQAALCNPRPRPLAPEDVDGTIILAAWLRERNESDGYLFPVAEGEPISAHLADWTAALHALLNRAAVE